MKLSSGWLVPLSMFVVFLLFIGIATIPFALMPKPTEEVPGEVNDEPIYIMPNTDTAYVIVAGEYVIPEDWEHTVRHTEHGDIWIIEDPFGNGFTFEYALDSLGQHYIHNVIWEPDI